MIKSKIRDLSHNGKFVVRFVYRPDFPEVFEFIARPEGKQPIRYINLSARAGANISVLV